MKNLELHCLEQMLESKHLDHIHKQVIKILLESINDWPEPILNTEEFISAIKNFIKSEPTEDAISSALKHIEFSKNSWQAESLHQVLEVFQFYNDNVSLAAIIADVQAQSLE